MLETENAVFERLPQEASAALFQSVAPGTLAGSADKAIREQEHLRREMEGLRRGMSLEGAVFNLLHGQNVIAAVDPATGQKTFAFDYNMGEEKIRLPWDRERERQDALNGREAPAKPPSAPEPAAGRKKSPMADYYELVEADRKMAETSRAESPAPQPQREQAPERKPDKIQVAFSVIEGKRAAVNTAPVVKEPIAKSVARSALS